MKRRQFLSTAAGAAAWVACGAPALFAKPASATRITLLHTNDTHSHLEPMTTGKYSGFGGAPARATIVNQVRNSEDHVLLLDAGDIFQGTPYFNLFNGEADFVAMNALKYDASAIGNHDFDAGIERLAELTRDLAEFKFINVNYDFSDTPMAGLAEEYMIREFDGVKVGLLGAGIKLDGLVSKRLYGSTQYLNPYQHVRRVAKMLRYDEKCDFIVVLSHINLYGESRRREPGDRDLIQIPEVDVVIGGHNHILLQEPEQHVRADGSIGYINQVGWAGTHLGMMQFDVYGTGKRELSMTSPIAAQAAS